MRALSLTAFALLAAVGASSPRLIAQSGAAPGGFGPSAASGAGFSIEYGQGYKLLTVREPWPGAARVYRYLLHPRGTPRPAGIAADAVFETPLRRVATFSTTYIPQIVAIGEVDSIVGVDAAGFVNDPAVRARVASGKTVEVSRNWSPNIELLIALAPDAVFTYGMGNEWDNHPKLAEAGLPIVISGEWNERDPLARARWIEFVAAFYDREAAARAYFEKVASEYRRIAAIATAAKDRPSVLVNGPFQGVWSVSGGRSYMAAFISDAGGDYLWSDDRSSGGLTLSVEAVYSRALGAEIWLNPGGTMDALGDLGRLDPRLAALPVVAAGNVWNNDRRVSPGGGNDYFESAILHPHEVLADLAEIFHPGLFPDRELVYYRKLRR